MIVYKSNKNWMQDIGHLAKSWTMVKVIRATILAGIYATGVAFLYHLFFKEQDSSVITSAFSLLGVVLSILLVFRTNSAYDRWWEGRKQWGALVNNTRNLAVFTHASLDKKNTLSRHQVAVYISNFCHAMTEHLREGTKIENLIDLTPEDIAYYEKQNHVPNAISRQLYDHIHQAYKAGELTDADLINFGPLHKSLLDIIGACERIKKTPIPFSYAVFMRLFITIYAVLLPFALAPQIGFYAIPIVMLVVFAFVGIELMGEEIEEPFGLDCNDLPTHTMSNMIQENVFEILELDPELQHAAPAEMYDKQF